MDWIVRLAGDDWSLHGLCDALQNAPTRVRRDDDGRYYLSSPGLSSCADEEAAWREAERLLSRVNDAAALDREHRSVAAGAVVRVESDGTKRTSVRLSGTSSSVGRARGSATIIRADGTIAPTGPSRPEKLCAALEREGTDSHLARALRVWRSRKRDWALLYHVYEIIKDDVSGGTGDYNALRVVTPAGMIWSQLDQELVQFRQTANDPAHTGSSARHGRRPQKPISNPMALKDAEDLIWRLLQRWTETKV